MSTAPTSAPVVDCFLFGGELELLRHRLTSLDPVVTTFVLVEAAMTHQGAAKRLHFREHRDGFAPWRDKIVYVEAALPLDASPWERERAQRAAARETLEELPGDTLVLVGDIDEIPFPEVVRELDETLRTPTRLHMGWSLYWANLVLPVVWDDGTIAFRARDKNHPALALVLGVPGAKWHEVPDPAVRPGSGWHYSWLGTSDDFEGKVTSYAHVEFRADRYSSAPHVRRLLDFGVDFLGRGTLELLPPNELPSPVRELAAIDASSMRTTPLPGRWTRAVYLSFTRLRFFMPQALIRWFDDHHVAHLLVVGPLVIVVERLMPVAKRAHRLLWPRR